MKTYAPSLTKSCAVANPMPSVPPVITATLPSNLPTAFLLLMPAPLPRRSAPLPPRTFVSKPNSRRTELDGSKTAKDSKNRVSLKKRLLKLCRTIGAHQPDVLSNQLLMLIEGAYSTASILGKRDAVKATAKAAEALIDSAIA